MPEVCIVICTFCLDDSSERAMMTRKCLDSIRLLKSNYGSQIYVIVWDNNSTVSFRKYLRTNNWLDKTIICSENYYDYGAVHALSLYAQRLRSPYVIYCNDDIEFYDFDFIEETVSVLSRHKNAGYVRLNQFDFHRLHLYDKSSTDPGRDAANSMRMYNWVSKKAVEYEPIARSDRYEYFKTNMHWHLFPGLCRTNALHEMCPYADYRPLQDLEGYMMKKYHKLDLDTLVLNEGICRHLAPPNLSMRLQKKRYPIVSWEACHEVIQSSF